MKYTKINADGSDLELVKLLVAKRLREQHGLAAAPESADYSLAPTERYHAATAELHLNVNLGRGVVVRVDQVWWREKDRDVEALGRCADEIADAYADLLDLASQIRGMLSEVAAATRREVAKAERRGIPCEIISMALEPIEVGLVDTLAVEVQIRALGPSLQLVPLKFTAQHAEDVTRTFEGLREEQPKRNARRGWLDSIGATCTIDALVASAIKDAGLDLTAVLKEFHATEDWVIDVVGADGRTLTLYWADGTIFASIQLADGITWHMDALTFANAPRSLSRLSRGTPLGKVFEHPHMDERLTIERGRGAKGERGTIYCNQALLAFDVDSGRLWPV